jgi:hypothetical protein
MNYELSTLRSLLSALRHHIDHTDEIDETTSEKPLARPPALYYIIVQEVI